MNKLQTHWLQEELIGIDSLQYSDEKMVIMEYRWAEHYGVRKVAMMPLCETSLGSIEKFNDNPWTAIQPDDKDLSIPDGRIVRFGYGAMGNEGFVALTTADNELIWAFFCTASNPFWQVEIHGDNILAISELGHRYTIAIDNPIQMSIVEYQGIAQDFWKEYKG